MLSSLAKGIDPLSSSLAKGIDQSSLYFSSQG